MPDLTSISAELVRYERQVGGTFHFADEHHHYRASHWVGGQYQWIMVAPSADLLMRWVRQYVADLSTPMLQAAE